MTIKRSALATASAVGAVVALTLTASHRWSPAPVMWPFVAEVVIPALPVFAYFFVVGLAVLGVLPRAAFRLSSPGMVIGLGIAVASLAIAINYVITGYSITTVWVVLVVSLVVIVAKGLVLWRSRSAPPAIRAFLERVLRWVLNSGDIVTLVLVIGVLFAVIQLGATSWTTFINDFQRYASSAAIWGGGPTGEDSFSAQHPDAYGNGALSRAAVEKPAATAFMVVVVHLSGLAPWRIVGPLMIILMFVVISALVTLGRVMFNNRTDLALVAAIPSTLSIVPLARLMDAQVGQVQAAALAAVTLAAVAVTPPGIVRKSRLAAAMILAICVAATLSSNLTLVLGVLPVIFVIVCWIESRRGISRLQFAKKWVIVAATSAILTAPFLAGFAGSLKSQTSEGAFPSVPEPSPWSLIGLEGALSNSDRFTNAASWITIIAIVTVVLLRSVRRSIDARMALILVGVSILSFAALAVLYGEQGYQGAKWLALFYLIGPPVLFSYALSRAQRWRSTPLAVGVLVCAGSFIVGSHFTYGPIRTVPHDLAKLTTSSRLQQLPVLNIALGNQYDASIAALASPAQVTIVTDPTYSAAAPPEGEWFLIRAGDTSREWTSVESLTINFSLARLDLGADQGALDITSAEGKNHLFGFWIEPTSTLSQSPRGSIVVTPTGELMNSDIEVTVTGVVIAPPEGKSSVNFSVGDTTFAQADANRGLIQEINFSVPRRVLADAGGSLIIDISGTGTTGIELGGSDPRTFVFQLKSIDLQPVAR